MKTVEFHTTIRMTDSGWYWTATSGDLYATDRWRTSGFCITKWGAQRESRKAVADRISELGLTIVQKPE